MMLVTLLVGVACGVIASIPVAGPASALIVKKTAGGQGRTALGIGMGAALAEIIYSTLGFLGVSFLHRFKWMQVASRVTAAALLIGAGCYFAFAKRKHTERSGGKASKRDGVVLGFLVTMANPMLILTWAAVVTIIASWGLLEVGALSSIVFGLGVGAGVVGWFSTEVQIIRKLRRAIEADTLDHAIRVIGWLLLAAGVGLIIKLVVTGVAHG